VGVPTPRDLVTAFNAAITRQDLDALTALMAEDHTFTDTGGGTVRGRDACRAAWAGFFVNFPDYRNEFAALHEDGDEVVAEGRSHCSEPTLDGPALWSATVRIGRLATWRVYDDTAENRAALGL
jgi:ketosteroid isomerase-like protein